ncbi:MAG: T9SS C-terminal target domain-containing protein [Bacteroidetes bacterium]|nr:MAG: T9SS C-terminal target domain-containing protein [Bacteroidota bacterium]
MKKIILSGITATILLLILTSSNLSDNGRAGATGSPGEVDCTNCHNSFAINSGGGSINFSSGSMINFEYEPGQTYNLSVTVARTSNGLFGVGIEALFANGDNAGTLNITDPASTQIKSRLVGAINRRNVVHQLNGGASNDSKTFNFSWTAPAAGTGPVTFYYAGVAANGGGTSVGDYVYKSSQVLTEKVCQVPGMPQSITGMTTLCVNSVQTYSVPPDANASSYIWTLPSGWTGSSNSNSITVTAGNMGGMISVTPENSCGSGQAQNLMINVNPSPVLNINASSNNDTLFATGGITYQWYLDNVLIPAATDSFYIPSQNGSYLVTGTDLNGCDGQSDPFAFTLTHIRDKAAFASLEIYPNPVSNWLMIGSGMQPYTNLLVIRNAEGKILFEGKPDAGRLDVSGFISGVYFVEINSGSQKHIRKFLVWK